MNKELVSIIIPYYNHKFYIEELLISIEQQSYKNIETILINDGSTDGSLKFLQKLKSRFNFNLVSTKNKGVCAAINQGLKLSKGKYITLIASDDVLVKSRIKEQVVILSNQPYDAVGGGMTLMTKDSAKLHYARPRKIGKLKFDDILLYNSAYAPTLMYKAYAFDVYGQYVESNPIEDYPMLLNMISKGAHIVNVDKNWAYYRIDDINYIYKAKWYLDGILSTLKNYEGFPTLINKARNHHIYLYLIKLAIFNGSADSSQFRQILQNNEFIITRLIKLLFLYILATLPRQVRQLIQKKIIYKSGIMKTLSNFLRI